MYNFEIYTIGVYASTEESFFNKLTDNRIDVFCDIRQRRGVRGSKYSYVNIRYLQDKLTQLGINYVYAKELAPTTEIREKQHAEDALKKEQKKERKELGLAFRMAYKQLILDDFDYKPLLNSLQELNCKKVALFCVEESPFACHRSLVATGLHDKYGLQIKHL